MVALDRPGTLGLLEREAEMAQLRAALDAVRADRRGRIRLRAGARFTLAGSRPAAASKHFLLLGSRPRLRFRHGL